MASIRLTKLLDQTLTPEQKTLVSDAENAAEQEVDRALDDFKARVKKRAEDFEKGDYVKEFDAALKDIQKDLTDTLAAYDKQVKELEDVATELEKLVQAANVSGADLEKHTKALKESKKALTTTLDEFHEKIASFTEKGGRLAVKAVTKAIL